MSDLQGARAREYIGRGTWLAVGSAFKSLSPAVYALPDGLEIELYSPIDIQRQRIFFADVRMVTQTSRTDWAAATLNGAGVGFFALSALILYLASEPAGLSTGLLLILALFVLGMLVTLARMIQAILIPQQVISIYGRRLCAELAKLTPAYTSEDRFVWLVEKVREANAAEQQRVAALHLAANPPPPPEIPSPELPPAEAQEPSEALPLNGN
jgi:hypothetical protein